METENELEMSERKKKDWMTKKMASKDNGTIISKSVEKLCCVFSIILGNFFQS